MLRAHIKKPDEGPKQIGVVRVSRGGFSAKIIAVEKGFHEYRGPATFSHEEIAGKIHHVMRDQLIKDKVLDPKIGIETADAKKILKNSIEELTKALKTEFPEAEFQPHYEDIKWGEGQGNLKNLKLAKVMEAFNKGKWKVELIKITSLTK